VIGVLLLLPFALGYLAGVVSWAARLVWAALCEGFARGYGSDE